MNITYRRPPKLAGIALSVAGALGFSPAAESGLLTIATEPLGTATSSIKPNVIFILDDSLSMHREYMPDYVMAPSAFVTGSAACFDSGDDDSGGILSDLARLDQCKPGDPPYMSPDFNTIYYNPAIYYRPGVNYDGTEMPVQDALETADWTKVRTDQYNVENWHQLYDTDHNTLLSAAEKTAASAIDVDLATGYPDRVWCKAPADAATGGNCRQNSAYTYPNYEFPFGLTNDTIPKPKYVTTAPYYYRMQTAQYCRPDGSDCKSGSAINPALHRLQAPEFCLDSELTDCAVGSAVTAKHVFSGVRWCNNQNLQEDPVGPSRVNYCQRKQIGAFIYPKHLGRTVSEGPATFPAIANEGQITVTSVNAGGGTINSITIGGVSVISGPIVIPSGSSVGAAASAIANAIALHASSPDFTAAPGGANVIITQTVAGSAGSGASIVVSTNSAPSASAKGTITIASVTGNIIRTISSITVGGTQLLCNAGTLLDFGNSVTVVAGTRNIVAANGWNTAQERDSVMAAIAARISSCALGGGYSATKTSAATVEVVAPLALGASANGLTFAVAGTTVSGFGTTPLAGGATAPTVGTSVTTMSGGADTFSGTRTVRIGVGRFVRTDIVPGVNSYPKIGTRADCLGATCTYAEEMTNFAN
jgi:type IV pilus assembly protein PilY1